ncbi:hypothetical protein [Flavivirga spongiicola]|uniref:YD repeat-containing protein n=1 Tax=Flavivirga spongiicola TaxID=421621 RepID=A0ABU7XT48_9FLAO|nr:hypothetical protein [Flavivirga sp. MEBiC05379]MDO5978928.1 hypothetical protein [Flavivirga sp. MEBiC05379]
MKKQNFLFTLFIGLSILSCSSDDNGQKDIPIEIVKLYKKTLVYNNGNISFDKEVFYNDENKIKSITINDYNYLSRTFTVSYNRNNISSIIQNTNFDNPNNADNSVTYNVTLENNKATLVSTANNSLLEIFFTNGYVDSTKFTFDTSSPTNYSEEVFTRDSNQNLISNSTGTETFTYSNFDSNKENDPFGGAMEYEYGDYFDILGLKVTKNNPLTGNYKQGSTNDTWNIYLEYDKNGFVTKSTREPNSITYYEEHHYIEL